MARLFTGAFENAILSEFTQSFGGTQGSVNVHSGFKSFKITQTGPDGLRKAYSTTDIAGIIYYREYIYITALPTGSKSGIMSTISIPAIGNSLIELALNTDGTLVLWDVWNNAQIGSASSALSINTQYYVEMSIDTTTFSSTACVARLNGTQFATGTVNLTTLAQSATGQAQIVVGINQLTPTTVTYYIDDVAVNDSTGVTNNSWPGETPGNTKYGNRYRSGSVGDGMGRSESWT